MHNETREIKINEGNIYYLDNAKFEELAWALCLTPEQLEDNLITAIVAIKDMFSAAWEVVSKVALSKWWIYQNNKHVYKYDFTRPIIQHQVLDRKPKWLIKKIIH